MCRIFTGLRMASGVPEEERQITKGMRSRERSPLGDGGDAALVLPAVMLGNSIMSGRTLSKTERQ